MSNVEVAEKVIKGHRLSKPDDCPDELYKIMTQCWSAEPNGRPSFEEIIEKLRDYLGLQRKTTINHKNNVDQSSPNDNYNNE